MYCEALNEILLTQKYRKAPPNTFYGLEAYGTQHEVACLKINKFIHQYFQINACFLDCVT